jgi:hypothetical protein
MKTTILHRWSENNIDFSWEEGRSYGSLDLLGNGMVDLDVFKLRKLIEMLLAVEETMCSRRPAKKENNEILF